MNKTQRWMLLIFSTIILLSSSYSSDAQPLKLFLAATLLFFGLSPKTWWNRRDSIQNETLTNQSAPAEASDEDEDLASVNPEIGGDKHLIQISQQSIAYCMSLYRLRIAEILRSYSEICMNYNSAKANDSWALKLLKDCAKYEGPSWDTKDEEATKKARAEAVLAYEKKFCRLFGWCPEPDDAAVVDMQLFLSVHSGASRGILRRLKYFKEINFAKTKIDDLINHYSTMANCVGDDYQFTNFLKHHERNTKEEKARDKARSSFIQARLLWEEIEDLLISKLLVAKDAKIDVTEHFDELEVFRTLRTCFREKLLCENKAELEKSVMKLATQEQDEKFREYFKQPSYYYIFE